MLKNDSILHFTVSYIKGVYVPVCRRRLRKDLKQEWSSSHFLYLNSDNEARSQCIFKTILA